MSSQYFLKYRVKFHKCATLLRMNIFVEFWTIKIPPNLVKFSLSDYTNLIFQLAILHMSHTRFKFITFIVLSALVANSCDMLESSPYDVHITGEKNLTNKNIALIKQRTQGKNHIKFAMISDSQRSYDETLDAVNFINKYDDIDFVVHGGDLTEFGATKEFLWQRDILNRLKVPYICVIGNHDCLATGVETYKSVFGPLNFSFTAGNVKFLCLNTNALEFDYSVSVPDMRFLKHELVSVTDSIRRTIVLMHAGPFSEQFGNNITDEFHSLLTQFPGLQFCLYGHGHNVRVDEPFNDGVKYYECANTKKRSLLLFTLNPNNSYDYEVVNF